MADVATPTDRLGSAAGQAGEAVQDKAEQVSQQIRQSTGQAQQRAVEEVTTRSRQAGEELEAVGRALHSSAEQLRNEGRGSGVGAIDTVAERLDQLSEYLKNSDGDRIISDLEDFGRRQPWAVILGGLTIGFAASRVLKASSSRRYRTRGTAPQRPSLSSESSTPSASLQRVDVDDVHERLATSGYVSGG
jgi:ElaB/YqjD/DUF883 family membrane-anchored ribosome-binding protein